MIVAGNFTESLVSDTNITTALVQDKIMDIQQRVLENFQQPHPPHHGGGGNYNLTKYDDEYYQFCKYFCDNCTIDYEYFDYDSYQNFTEVTENIVIVFFVLVLLSGLIGNGVVVRVIVKDGITKAVTNLYFLNLAIADLLFLIICVPTTFSYYIFKYWPFGSIVCKLTNYLGMVSMTISITTLTAMGVDRYIAVHNPIRSRANRTVSKAIPMIIVMWVANCAICIPVFFIFSLDEFPYPAEGRHYYCHEHFPGDFYRKLYTLIIFFVFYAIPLIIIAICYFLMATSKRLEWHPGSTGAIGRQARSRRRIAKTVAVVVTTFAVCWLPLHPIQLVMIFFSFETFVTYNIIYIVKIVAHMFSYSNSAVNPFIYAFMSNDFRRSFKETFASCFCCKKYLQQFRRYSTPSQTHK